MNTIKSETVVTSNSFRPKTEFIMPIGFELVSGHAPVHEHEFKQNSLLSIFDLEKPLPPLVEAKMKEESLVIQAVFFIRGSVNLDVGSECGVDYTKGFNVFMKEKWTGTAYTPEFIIQYDIDEKHKCEGKDFTVYSLNLTIDPILVKPAYITTYLWNSDPDGSRGTETAVLPG